MSVLLYHGTPNLMRVLEEGLIPNEHDKYDASLEGYVYMARSPDLAASFGHVVEVTLPSDIELEWDPQLPEEAVIYEGRIPPERIERYTGPLDVGATAVGEEEEIPQEDKMDDMMRAMLIDDPRPVEDVVK